MVNPCIDLEKVAVCTDAQLPSLYYCPDVMGNHVSNYENIPRCFWIPVIHCPCAVMDAYAAGFFSCTHYACSSTISLTK